jgi:hypothetical protein
VIGAVEQGALTVASQDCRKTKKKGELNRMGEDRNGPWIAFRRALGLSFCIGAALLLGSCVATKEAAMGTQRRIVEYELAALNEPDSIGKTRVGNPHTVDSPYGKVVQFDGAGDAIFLDTNPLRNLSEFTVEVIFRPDPKGPPEQRFLQMGEVNRDRMMLETRLTADDQWCLDAHIRSGDSARTLIDKQKVYPTGTWHHVALVVDGGKMHTYVDGTHELEGTVTFSPFRSGRTSIGVRMNRMYWFKGAIYKIRITPKALAPSHFMKW